MQWLFWRKAGPVKVSSKVQTVLSSRFHLDPQVANRARCLEKPGVFGGRPVRHVRIFDPALLPGGGVPLQAFDTLNGHRRALLFEGRIEGDGSVRLVDRRSPLRR